MTNLINCGTCGYPLTPEERTTLIERDGVMVKPAPVQEPVAWMHKETGLLRQANKAKGGDFEPNHWTPLYTTPPAQPAPVQKRPQNCGTGYCSCIECVMEPAPVATHYVDGGHLVYPTAQRTWVGLTDEERNHARQTVTYSQIAMTASEWAEAVQIETERRLKEKNT